MPHYNLLRSDRRVRRGGGVCAWLHDSLKSSLFSSSAPHPPSFESLFFRFSSVSRRFLFCLLYVPPGLIRQDHDDIVSYVTQTLDDALSRDADVRILVCGDFNDLTTSFLSEQFGLVKKVLSPTRGEATLDQIFIDCDLCELYEDSAVVGPPIKNSDHCSVFLHPLKRSISDDFQHTHVVPVWDFRKSFIADFLSCLSQANFSSLKYLSSVDEMVTAFYALFDSCASVFPCHYVTFTKNDKPWMTPVLKVLIQQRWCAFRAKNWTMYNHFKLRVKQEIVKAKSLWAEKQRRSAKGIWNVVNELRGKRISDPMARSIEEFSSMRDFLEELSSVFEKNFNSDEDVELQNLRHVSWNLNISPQDVLKKLKKLKAGKAYGPDNVPTRLLIFGARLLCVPLALIFNKSIRTKTFPTAFKTAHVCPIPKKSNPSIYDFRPISILSIIGKVLEHLVLDAVKDDLVNCYSCHQHAYRPLGSATSALVEMQDAISLALDSCETSSVRVLCLDLSKAFDGLQHFRLLNYLNHKGLHHGFLSWLQSYLSLRQFRVKVRNNFGRVVSMPSGVPQGSILGPFLFAAFMGQIDFCNFSSVRCIQYADDVTIIEPISKKHSQVIPFDYVTDMFHNVGLKLNRLKCNVMFLQRSSFLHVPSTELPIVSSMKILGLIFTNTMSWSLQFSEILTRASRRLYVIRCLKGTITKRELICVYHAIVTSLFLYASPVYGKITVTLLTKIERFQRRAHRIICGMDCQCENFPPLKEKFNDAGIKFLLSCETNLSHPLHHLVPPRLPRTGHFRLPSVRSARRLKSFFPHFCLMCNERSSSTI